MTELHMRSTILSVLCVGALTICPLASAQALEDTDGDGLRDSEEDINGNGVVDNNETNPLNADSDGGGEADGSEVQAGRNPLDRTDDLTFDLDGDGLSNGQEYQIGTDPAATDTDGDGIDDHQDIFPLERAYAQDSDKDGLPDEYEATNGLESSKRSDAEEDADGDGLSNLEEFIQGTDIYSVDTDNDGIPDGQEVERGDDPLENPCLSDAGPSEVLQDIQEHWSQSYVTALQQTKSGTPGERIVGGYTTENGLLFKPDQEISRFELLKMALLSACIIPNNEPIDSPIYFSDVRTEARPYDSPDMVLRRKVIYEAAKRGIIQGYPDGSFRPDDTVNRAEALKILFLASKLEPFSQDSSERTFTDVPENTWFSSYVDKALGYRFLEGYPDGTFRPQEAITRAEAAKLTLFTAISNPYINGYIIPVQE